MILRWALRCFVAFVTPVTQSWVECDRCGGTRPENRFHEIQKLTRVMMLLLLVVGMRVVMARRFGGCTTHAKCIHD
ncbi:hypothetical protein EDB19DRAFT_1729253 [Suillus lakei]|nr:hypothetical protein EDB19DRAFT_1729253 [Suillus lakei]